MSSCEESSPAVFDSNMMNQLIFSIGRLKFSLRALECADCENALLPPQETGAPSHTDSEPFMESNKILENAISEILSSSRREEFKKKDSQSTDNSQNDSSVEKLQILHDKLKDELQKIKSDHQSILLKKLEKYKSSLTPR